ncbi:MAG: STAS domain-containing protein [Gammaproteobacteria bacterium]|nr:STAS domain-containing protein [Gammaproteobacteria bacterium]
MTATTAAIKFENNQFYVSGVLCFDSVGDLNKQSRSLFLQASNIHLDLAAVVSADSAAVAILLEWMRFAKAAGKDFKLDNIPPQILEIAAMSGVEDFL